MKKSFFILAVIATLSFFACFNLSAQDAQTGKVIYEQIVDYNLEGAYDDPRWDSYIADLPKEGKSVHILTFSAEKALFQEDLSQKEGMSSQLKKAIMKVNYSKTPKPVVKKIYFDFKKKEKIEQVEFMTRDFLVESPLENKAWKLTNKMKKVLDYVCMGADLQVGEETITAWFTSEIPVSAGPGPYYGLPGLILGLEKDEDIFMLATAIDLTAPEGSLLAIPDKGQKYAQEKFDKIVEEKTVEYEKAIKAEKRGGKNR